LSHVSFHESSHTALYLAKGFYIFKKILGENETIYAHMYNGHLGPGLYIVQENVHMQVLQPRAEPFHAAFRNKGYQKECRGAM